MSFMPVKHSKGLRLRRLLCWHLCTAKAGSRSCRASGCTGNDSIGLVD